MSAGKASNAVRLVIVAVMHDFAERIGREDDGDSGSRGRWRRCRWPTAGGRNGRLPRAMRG